MSSDQAATSLAMKWYTLISKGPDGSLTATIYKHNQR